MFTLCLHHRGLGESCSSSALIGLTDSSPLPLFTPVISLLCFPDEPNVTLSGECRGELKINNSHVCSSNWNLDYSHLVCQEQPDCSNAVFYDRATSSVNTQLQHVACEDHHDKLGQCNRYEGPCADGPVSVYCVGTYGIRLYPDEWGYFSHQFFCVQQYLPEGVLCCFPGGIRFRTTGRCGGQIQVNYRNKWENVYLWKFPSRFKEELCQELGCQGYNASIRLPKRNYVVILLLHHFSYQKPNICCKSKSKSNLNLKMSSTLFYFSSPRPSWKQRWTAVWITTTLGTVLLFMKPVKEANRQKSTAMVEMLSRYQGLTNLDDSNKYSLCERKCVCG